MIPAFEKYLAKHKQFTTPLSNNPNKELNNIVIIPAHNEPDLLQTLESLKNCKAPKRPTEIIVVINHSEHSSKETIQQNELSYSEISLWTKNNSNERLVFLVMLVANMPKKYAGVGLARKIGMDEAIRRFSKINNENGIIFSLDADTLVGENYLHGIEKEFFETKNLNTVLPWFEHISETESTKVQSAIVQYELHLRYFKLALKYTGFPNAYHTIGSAFAVKAMAYIKQGGMNKKQGGEDFYFLQKVFNLSYTKELISVKVYPSGRVSERVPFGTGPAVQKIIEEGKFLTYKPEYFEYLKAFFDQIKALHKTNAHNLNSVYNSLNKSIQNFVPFQEFENKTIEINNNCSSYSSFVSRFYQWFDAFKIIKYLNACHSKDNRIFIIDAAKGFLLLIHETLPMGESSIDLLKKFKEIERIKIENNS